MSTPADHHTLEVPSTSGRHFLVEFPGYVRNEDRALQTFGGIPGLSAQRQAHSRNLQLRLRPGDPCCHPLVSNDAKPARCIVLKLTRKRRQQHHEANGAANGPAASFRAEVVATVDETYRFTSPADFQYAGRDLRPEEEQYSVRYAGSGDNPMALPRQPLLCTPPAFAVEGLVDYAFKQYRAADHGVDFLGGRLSRRTSAVAQVDFFAAAVPAAPPAAAPPVREALQPIARRLSELLQKRPVILEAALVEEMAGTTAPVAVPAAAAAAGTSSAAAAADVAAAAVTEGRVPAEVLTRLCYKFKNGPWKDAWVRKGYDPRSDPGARQYQVLEYSLPAEWYSQFAQHRHEGAGAGAALLPLATSYSQLCSFSALPGTSTTQLQLCDLRDDRVAAALAAGGEAGQEGAAPPANDATGWLPAVAWEGIKQAVQRRFQLHLDLLAAALAAGPAPMEVDEPGAGAAAARASRAAQRGAQQPPPPPPPPQQQPPEPGAKAEAPPLGGLLAQLQEYLARLAPGEGPALRAGPSRADGGSEGEEEEEERGEDEDGSGGDDDGSGEDASGSEEEGPPTGGLGAP